jgi:hypothetical protein
MMSWMQGKSYADACLSGRYHLLHPFSERHSPWRSVRATEKLPDDFPDYCVFVTRHSLLALTASLADVSGEAHSFFVRLNYAFAMDRLMRGFMFWAMPGTPAASTPLTVLQSWFPAARPETKLNAWSSGQMLLPPASPHPVQPSRALPQDASQNVATAYAAMMAFSTACLNAGPAAMDAWRTSTAA